MSSTLAILSILSLLIGVKVVGSTDPKCTHSAKRLDLQLIVDSSASMGEENFHLLMQEIADDVVGQFDIGKDKTRVSLFKYSSSKVMVEEFDLDGHTDAASLKKAIKAVEFEKGWTMTGQAMEKALTHYLAKMRNDEETAKACMVFTDGASNDAVKVPAASKAWQEKGVTVLALGIGQGIDAAGLKAITGSEKTFMQVANVKAITEAAKSLLAKFCKEVITKPKLDMVGKIDASSIYSSEYNKENAFSESQYWCSSKGKWPAEIWMNFEQPRRLAKIGFKSWYKLNGKVSFEVIGSNDCKHWTTLLHIDDLTHSTKYHASKTWLIPYSDQPYSCFGLKFIEKTDYTYVCINNIEMWAYP